MIDCDNDIDDDDIIDNNNNKDNFDDINENDNSDHDSWEIIDKSGRQNKSAMKK